MGQMTYGAPQDHPAKFSETRSGDGQGLTSERAAATVMHHSPHDAASMGLYERSRCEMLHTWPRSTCVTRQSGLDNKATLQSSCTRLPSWQVSRAAVAGDLGGDALEDLGRQRVGRERQGVGVAVDVDEAGADR